MSFFAWKQIMMKKMMGTMLAANECQLEIPNAVTIAPTSIRNMVPGPKIVPSIRRTYMHM